MLEIKNLSVSYNGTSVLKDINLKITKGEFVAIFGTNGAGKSTLLKTISGLLRPERGEILFEGRSITGLHPFVLVERGIIFLPQGNRVFPHLTVDENLEVMVYKWGKKERKKLVEKAFSLFPILKERKKILACRLSGGEQQMVALARAMVIEPKLLLLDEPSLGLSPLWVDIIFEEVKRIHKFGTAVILVEQKIKEASEVAQRCYVLEFGKLFRKSF